MNDQPHNQILKSTTIIGGSSAINIVFQIIRSKAVAVLLGPTGVAVMGLFNSVLGMATTIAGMGLSTSGVRQIAEAATTGDSTRISRTITAFRRLALFFGILGAVLFFLLRQPISQMTFGNDEYALPMGSLAIALLLTVYSTAQSTLIRGMRRIADLARVSVIGIAVGVVLGIPLLYIWGIRGIAPYLILSAVTTILVSWWYSRKIPIAKTTVTLKDISNEGRTLLTLGIVFVITSLAALAAPYLVKVLVVRTLGLASSGLYESASTLSSVYVGFILGAMAADFFPHLTSVSHDHLRAGQIINAQVEIGLLLAIPGILAVLALGPYLIRILYSDQFSPAFEILRWMVLGTFLRVISWPNGFLILSMGKSKIYFLVEISTDLMFLLLTALCIPVWGLTGIGLAFMGEYIFYTVITTLIARKLIDFHWSRRNLQLAGLFFPVILAAFLASLFLKPVLSAAFGLLLAAGVCVYSVKSVYTLVGPTVAQSYWQRIKARLRWRKTG